MGYQDPEKRRAYNRAYREANAERERARWKAYREANKDRIAAQSLRYRDENWESRLLLSARMRARSRGQFFDLQVGDVRFPPFCPLCGEEMRRRAGLNLTPSLDRIIPSLGYTKNNIIVICMCCNRKKQNTTLEELLRMVQFYTKLIADRGLKE